MTKKENVLQPEEPKDEEKVSDQLKKLRKSKNPNFSVLEKGKEEEKKSGIINFSVLEKGKEEEKKSGIINFSVLEKGKEEERSQV